MTKRKGNTMRHRLLQNDAELTEATKLMRFVEVVGWAWW